VQWDRNEGRWTCVLEDGTVVHVEKVPEGWLVLIPALWIRAPVRNVHLQTWLTAQPVVERTIEALLHWQDPHAQPVGASSVLPQPATPLEPLPQEKRPPWARSGR
jgi:hypothetical protein